MKSIRTKMLAIVGVLFVIALGCLGGLNYWQANRMLVGQLENELVLKAQERSAEITAWIQYSQAEIRTLSRSPVIYSGERQAIVSYLAAEVKNNGLYETILWIEPDGTSVNADGIVRNDKDREYFRRAMTGETVVAGPNISKGTGRTIISVATPVRLDNKTIGVLAGVVNIEKIEAMVRDIRVGQSGYAFVLKEDGLVLMHPDANVAGKVNLLSEAGGNDELALLAKSMTAQKRGFGIYDQNGVGNYLAYAPVTGTDWSLAINIPVAEALGSLNAFARLTLFTIIAVLLVAIGIIFVVAGRFARPLQILAAKAQQIAAGDLSVQALELNTRDEVGALARAFDAMTGNLRNLVVQINDSAGTVAISAEELTRNVEQSAQAVNQVAVGIMDTAQNVDRQVQCIDRSIIQGGSIASASNNDVEKMKSAIDEANNAVAVVDSGTIAITNAVAQMHRIRQAVDASAAVITELGGHSNQIGQIVEAIANIAGQTNLLALNAAIEAARAGEQGRGFAVVAEEVRKLAEQSQTAAAQIAVLINDIQGKTSDAVQAMGDGTQEVMQGVKVVAEAGKAFEDIGGRVKNVAAIALETSEGLNMTATGGLELQRVLQEAADVSHSISGQTENISAATEEQSASMQEIASASQQLAHLAEELKGLVGQFKT